MAAPIGGVASLLRSIIDFDGGVSTQNLAGNLKKLDGTKLAWVRPEDQKIYDFVKTYFETRLDSPQEVTVRDYFESAKDQEVLERLKDIKAADVYIRTNFSNLLQDSLEKQHEIEAQRVLQECKEIVTKGLEIEGEKLKGVKDAITHFSSQIPNLSTCETNARLEGDIRNDGQEVWNDYIEAKANKVKAFGKFLGLDLIDGVCKGIKKSELWIHAASAGELKTTLATTWAYNLVTHYKSNVLYMSFEMSYEQLRMGFYAMHSSNGRFQAMGYKPIPFNKLRDGGLTPDEEAFLKIVIEDFCNNPNYAKLNLWRPADLDVDMDQIKLQAELSHKKDELGLLILDHGGLIQARKKKRNKDFGVELNSVIRDAKKLALNFNEGEGLPVLMLFQINRQGKAEADKNEGEYRLSALAYANEAERSADVVTTTYLNKDLRANGRTRVQNLKNRSNPMFETFEASVDWDIKKLQNLDTPGVSLDTDDGMKGFLSMY